MHSTEHMWRSEVLGIGLWCSGLVASTLTPAVSPSLEPASSFSMVFILPCDEEGQHTFSRAGKMEGQTYVGAWKDHLF